MSPTRRPNGQTSDRSGGGAVARDHVSWHGHPSRAHLEYWLDGQVVAGHLTPATARLYLPDYQPLDPTGCRPNEPTTGDYHAHAISTPAASARRVSGDEAAVDEDVDEAGAGW